MINGIQIKFLLDNPVSNSSLYDDIIVDIDYG